MSSTSPKEVSRHIITMEMQKEIARNTLGSESGSSIESLVAWYHHMQQIQPVRYRPEYNLWEVFRYKDVEQVLLDCATFSVDKCLPEGFPVALGKSDPPEHRQLRNLVSKVFTPRRIEELTPRLVQIVDELLEVAIANGKMHVDTQFAHLLPGCVIAEMLGLPPQDHQRFYQWSSQLVDQLTGIANPDNTELLQYFSDLLTERKRDPRDDLVSELLAIGGNGTHLSYEMLLSLCVELMTAGNVTTSRLLILTFERLCQHPEIYQALRYDPALIPGFIEEMLRYDFSSLDLWRTARHDTVLSGQEIKAGQYVVAWTAAANFDETYFLHSEQFDIRRSPNPHLTFGHGVHVCLGAPLARLEIRIALERIVTHFSKIRLAPEKPLRFLAPSSESIPPFCVRFTSVASPSL